MHYFTAISAGPEIAELPGTRGWVLAALSNAVYLRSERGHILCVAGPAAEDGPFTLRVGEIDLFLRLLKGRERLTFACEEQLIELTGIARLDSGLAKRWQEQPPSAIAGISGRLRAVRALLNSPIGSLRNRRTRGLAAYLYGSHRSLPLPLEVPWLGTNSTTGDMLLRELTRRSAAFQAAASELDIERASAALVSLLGLGVGLTPSGDDVVAGILASLVWQARLGAIPADFTLRLVDGVRGAAQGRTNEISVRLLWHAGDGLLYAPAMELGAALLAGVVPSIAAPALRLLSIGHSSGADLATGLLAGIVAGIEIESRSRVPSY